MKAPLLDQIKVCQCSVGHSAHAKLIQMIPPEAIVSWLSCLTEGDASEDRGDVYAAGNFGDRDCKSDIRGALRDYTSRAGRANP